MSNFKFTDNLIIPDEDKNVEVSMVSNKRKKIDQVIPTEDVDCTINMASNKREKINLISEIYIPSNKDKIFTCKKKLTQTKLNMFIKEQSIEGKISQQNKHFDNTLIDRHVTETDSGLQEAGLMKWSLHDYTFRCITNENLNLKYARIFSKESADCIFQCLEEQVQYFSGELLKVKVYGKWYNIPRKQVCYGDPGLTYSFSGTCLPARPWSECAVIEKLKKTIESFCQHPFNFVLVNRYKDGNDHMGEHRDDEKDLVPNAPIASVSFGQVRDFIFKHKDSRGKKHTRNIPPVTLQLEHGSLLVMQWPTNRFWYHSLPVRANAKNVRINLTFRHMVV